MVAGLDDGIETKRIAWDGKTDFVIRAGPSGSASVVNTNPVPLPDLQSALDALILESAPPPPGPDEFTIQMVAERAKVERHKATKMILEWVEAGRVELVGKRRGKRGHLVDAWRVRV